MPNANTEWNSQAYHQVSNPQFEWGLKVLDRLHLHGDERLMDAGCGSGRLTEKLLDRLPHGHVVGVDLSQNMLDQAAEHLKPYDSRISFLRADLAHLPFNSEFDGIFSTAAFHWVKDHNALFASLFRSLRPGGWLIAQCGGGPNLKDVRRRANKLIDSPRYASYFGAFENPWEYADAETTANRMRRAGFTDVRTWLESSPIHFNSAGEYKAFMVPVILRSYLNVLPNDRLKQQFADDLIDEAVKDPNFHLDYWRLNLSGTRN
ncbi:MAG TPA: methyltransferase domain-containing protein [Terriglobales bacterium]|nr:methyltransferase domain-containing protein [Terriglobales bacterium]